MGAAKITHRYPMVRGPSAWCSSLILCLRSVDASSERLLLEILIFFPQEHATYSRRIQCKVGTILGELGSIERTRQGPDCVDFHTTLRCTDGQQNGFFKCAKGCSVERNELLVRSLI